MNPFNNHTIDQEQLDSLAWHGNKHRLIVEPVDVSHKVDTSIIVPEAYEKSEQAEDIAYGILVSCSNDSFEGGLIPGFRTLVMFPGWCGTPIVRCGRPALLLHEQDVMGFARQPSDEITR